MGDVVYISLSSADASNPSVATAAGNAVFQNSFEYPLIFDQGNYEVALFSLTTHLSSGFDPATAGSIYVYSNFVEATQVLGSSKTNLLRRLYIDSVGRTDHTFDNLMYVPLAGSRFSKGEIELRLATGVLPGMEATQGTTVTLAIRRKIFSV